VGTGVISRGKAATEWTTHLHLVPRLRMYWAIPEIPLYAFMARKGKILPFAYIIPSVCSLSYEGPQPLPKGVLHALRSDASSFKLEYSLSP
jgi:hypothetical protein